MLREPLVGGRSRGLPDLELRQDPCVEWARLLLLQLLGLLLGCLLHAQLLLHLLLPHLLLRGSGRSDARMRELLLPCMLL